MSRPKTLETLMDELKRRFEDYEAVGMRVRLNTWRLGESLNELKTATSGPIFVGVLQSTGIEERVARNVIDFYLQHPGLDFAENLDEEDDQAVLVVKRLSRAIDDANAQTDRLREELKEEKTKNAADLRRIKSLEKAVTELSMANGKLHGTIDELRQETRV